MAGSRSKPTPEQVQIWARQKAFRKEVADEKLMFKLCRDASDLKTKFMEGKMSQDEFVKRGTELAADLDKAGYRFHQCREPYGGYWNVRAYRKSEK